jgi:hypothetical protein
MFFVLGPGPASASSVSELTSMISSGADCFCFCFFFAEIRPALFKFSVSDLRLRVVLIDGLSPNSIN